MRWNHLQVEADPAFIVRKLFFFKDIEHIYTRGTARESGPTKADDALGCSRAGLNGPLLTVPGSGLA
jgi:hypothetical protein